MVEEPLPGIWPTISHVNIASMLSSILIAYTFTYDIVRTASQLFVVEVFYVTHNQAVAVVLGHPSNSTHSALT